MYADDPNGSQMSPELLQLGYIDRFGAQAVMGRSLGYLEAQHMMLAENVLKAYRGRSNSNDWATWAKEHPGQSDLLSEATVAAREYGWE